MPFGVSESAHNRQLNDIRNNGHSLEKLADKEYLLFCNWARFENNQDFSDKSLKKYLKETKREMWDTVKGIIAEKYFGYYKKYNPKNNSYKFYKKEGN